MAAKLEELRQAPASQEVDVSADLVTQTDVVVLHRRFAFLSPPKSYAEQMASNDISKVPGFFSDSFFSDSPAFLNLPR